MKKFINDNYKILIVVFVFITCIIAVSQINMSLAATNTIPIYTRDELSEKMDSIDNDTGWVSLVPYMNPIFSEVEDENVSPEARRINDIVYLRGELTGYGLVNGTIIYIFENIPSQFRPKKDLNLISSVSHSNGQYNYRLTITRGGKIWSNANSYGTFFATSHYQFNAIYSAT